VEHTLFHLDHLFVGRLNEEVHEKICHYTSITDFVPFDKGDND